MGAPVTVYTPVIKDGRVTISLNKNIKNGLIIGLVAAEKLKEGVELLDAVAIMEDDIEKEYLAPVYIEYKSGLVLFHPDFIKNPKVRIENLFPPSCTKPFS